MRTTDYELFDYFNSNRKLTESHVLKLISSIKKIGYIESNPILVNDDLEIIDGQHRYEACKRLGLPIIYEHIGTNHKSMQHEIIMELNKTQKTWSISDYIESWAREGYEDYKKLIKYSIDHKISLTIASMIYPEYDLKGEHIKKGKSFNKNIHANAIAKFLKEIDNNVPYAYSAKFVRAVKALFSEANEMQITKLKKQIVSIAPQVSISSYERCFENVINKGVADKNKLIISVK